MNVTVPTQFTADDPLAVVLTVVAVAIVAIALVIANHNLKDRF